MKALSWYLFTFFTCCSFGYNLSIHDYPDDSKYIWIESTLAAGYKILLWRRTLQTELTFWSLSPGSLLSAYILQFVLFKMPNLNRKRTSDSSSLWSISNLYRTSFSKQRSSGLSAKLDFKTVRGDCSTSGLTSLTPNYTRQQVFGLLQCLQSPPPTIYLNIA